MKAEEQGYLEIHVKWTGLATKEEIESKLGSWIHQIKHAERYKSFGFWALNICMHFGLGNTQ